MKINAELTEKELKELIVAHFYEKIGASLDADKIRIEVKSKQNYRSEWETSCFRAKYDGEI